MRTLLVALCLLTLFIAQPTAATTHYVTGRSSVDGSIIAWGGTTAYSSQCASAMATWNARGEISITPDTAWTIEDLTFSDVNSTSILWYGVYGAWTQRTGADRLNLNQAYMGGASNSKRQMVCTHELGHSLGLDHHTLTGNVMYETPTTTTSLGAQDISDYIYLYP